MGTKTDLPDTAARGMAVSAFCERTGVPFVAISAATGAGLAELRAAIAAALEEIGWLQAAS